ncbi:MAG: GTP-binding protein [Promethearchaeota archaeon]
MSDDYDYLFKCICVGDGGCGKTALVIRFSQGYFEQNYRLTIGVEFAIKTIEIPEVGKKVKLQIWDTGGQERFQYVRPLYYRGAMGAIVLFDLTNRESFDHIPKWIEEVRTNAGDIPMLLVGNKKDLVDERQISREEAEELAKELNMYYIESSAKDGTGVGDVFAILSCLMMGVEVPAVFLQGTEVVDTSGKILGSSKESVASKETSVPMEEVYAENSQESEALPTAFASIESSEEEIPPYENESIPILEANKEEDLFDIPSVSESKKIEQQSFMEEWEIPSSSSSSQNKAPIKADDIPPVPPKPSAKKPSSGPIVFTALDSIPKEELEDISATIPPVPPKPSAKKPSSGPIVFTAPDSIPKEELEDISATIPPVPPKPSAKKSSSGPIVFTAPDSIPEEELEDISATIPPVPPKPSAKKSSSGPIVFTAPDSIPEEESEDISATIPPVPPKPTEKKQETEPILFASSKDFVKEEDIKKLIPPVPPKDKKAMQGPLTFDVPKKKSEMPQKPVTFINARPATPPPGFKPRTVSNPIFAIQPKQNKKETTSIPFMGSSSQSKKSVDSMNTFLGALGSKIKEKPKSSASLQGFQPFTPKTSAKESSKPAFFIPKVEQEKPKEIPIIKPFQPGNDKLNVAEAKKDKKKDKKKKKKDKNIIICPTCGAILNSSYKFCNKCGTKL